MNMGAIQNSFATPNDYRLEHDKTLHFTGNFQAQWSVWGATVDGRNPAPVEKANISLFTGFPTCWVVQDFFHQQ